MLSCPSSAARHVEPGECRGCGGGAGRAPRPCARPARRRLRSPRAAPASAGEASGGDEPLAPRSFGPLDEGGLPTQGRAVVRGTALAERSDPGGDSLAYLSVRGGYRARSLSRGRLLSAGRDKLPLLTYHRSC